MSSLNMLNAGCVTDFAGCCCPGVCLLSNADAPKSEGESPWCSLQGKADKRL